MNARDREYEYAFLVLAGMFIASLVVCNLIVQKFFLWEPFGIREYFYLSAGILPYPLTFLVTDILSECYGKRRANQVVMAGLVASVFVVPRGVGVRPHPVHRRRRRRHRCGDRGRGLRRDVPPDLRQDRARRRGVDDCLPRAQLVDIQLFHFWRRLTKGKHLWLRNNASTVISQLLDTSLVVSLLFVGTEMAPRIPQMILAGWSFKAMAALIDTPLFYAATAFWRRRYPDQVRAHDDLVTG